METLIYIPESYINSNYNYFIDNNHIVVDNNGICNNIYFDYDYIVSNSYACSTSQLVELDSNKFTNNWHYRVDSYKIYIETTIYIVFVCLLYVVLIRVFRKGLNI